MPWRNIDRNTRSVKTNVGVHVPSTKGLRRLYVVVPPGGWYPRVSVQVRTQFVHVSYENIRGWFSSCCVRTRLCVLYPVRLLVFRVLCTSLGPALVLPLILHES